MSLLLFVRMTGDSSMLLAKTASMLLTALLCFLRFPAQPPSLLMCLPAEQPGTLRWSHEL